MVVRAILFDLDETLWHYPILRTADALHAQHVQRIAPLLRAWGAIADGDALSRRLLAAVEREMAAAQSGSLLSPDFLEIVGREAAGVGLELDGDQLARLWDAWQLSPHEMGVQPYPDTATTLAWARACGLQLGMVANRWCGVARLRRELAPFGLADAFDAVAVSAEVGWLKPHPAVFGAALDALGVQPHEAVMVGDRLDVDVAGAARMGIRAVWKRNGRRQPTRAGSLLPPDAVIDDLWEVRRLPLLLGPTALDVPRPPDGVTAPAHG